MVVDKAVKRLKEIDREVLLLSHILSVLSLDQDVLPSKGAEERGAQVGLLERQIHTLVTSDELGEIIATLEGVQLGEVETAMVRHAKRDWERERRLDGEFVQLFSETTAKAYPAWVKARQEDDFKAFAPTLEMIATPLPEKAEALGHSGEPYDPLLDLYEEGTTTAEVESLFSEMGLFLKEILEQVGEREVDDTFLYGKYPQESQDFFIREVLTNMGFDWERGLLHTAVHPATSTLGAHDIRITTRYEELSVASPLFSAIHEGGHALYEMAASQGVCRGTTLGSGVSLGFHESQSRLWENMIGRSGSFWDYYFPQFKELFPLQLANVDEGQFLAAINRVKATPIRVDADEVTYGLHIIARFELEKSLLKGDLKVKDLSGAWAEKMEKLLNIKVKSDRLGVLQDVHWSMGVFGYFPTYALGNLYGAQISAIMANEIDLDYHLKRGELTPIREWLEAKILKYGALYQPKELLNKVTGSPLRSSHFKEYLTKKYLEI